MKKNYNKPMVISGDMFEQTANQTGPNSDSRCEIPSLVVEDFGCRQSFPGDGSVCDSLPIQGECRFKVVLSDNC